MRKVQTIATIVFSTLLMSCGSGHQKTEKHDDTLHAQLKHSEIQSQTPLDPQEVLAKLKEGNRSFVMKLSPSNIAHDSSYNYFDQMAHTRHQQHPIACILTCMDSRVPPEIIFDLGIGSLFILRVAGNIADPDMLGSMEYAIAEKGVGVVVVMGHTNCGAISAAFGKVDPVNKELASLVAHVQKDIISIDKPPYDASAKHHVKKTIENILSGSKTIHEKLLHGELIIVGALYDVGNGTIDWNTDHW